MKIVFLNPSGQLGGAERILLDLVASLQDKKKDWKYHLIAAAEGPLIAESQQNGISTHVLPFSAGLAKLGDTPTSARANKISVLPSVILNTPSIYRYQKDLKLLLRRMGPDLVHSNGLKMHLLGAMTKIKPIVWHMHDYFANRPLAAKLLQQYSSDCSGVIGISNSVVEEARSILKNRVPAYTVRNAIDLQRFRPEGESLDLDQLSTMPPLRPGGIRIGLVSTFALWKGHEVFFEAIKRLPQTMSFRGYVIGGPLYQTEGSQWKMHQLRAMAAKMGIEDRVGFTGFVEEPANAIRSLDIVVHASTQPDPFGLVIAEAMACGRAAIVTNTAGATESIQPGIDALTYPSGNADALRTHIELLLKNENLRKSLGVAGRLTAETFFDRTRLGNEIIPIYEEIVQRNAHASSSRS